MIHKKLMSKQQKSLKSLKYFVNELLQHILNKEYMYSDPKLLYLARSIQVNSNIIYIRNIDNSETDYESDDELDSDNETNDDDDLNNEK